MLSRLQHRSRKKKTVLRSTPQSPGERLSPVMRPWGTPDLVPLDTPLKTPRQLSYLDLLPKQASHHGAGLHAVAEHQGNALLYLVDARGGTRTVTPRSIHELQRLLANRSDSAWLGIVRPGALDLYPVEFAAAAPAAPAVTIPQRDSQAPLFFQSLVHATFRESGRLPASDHVYQQILSLLQRTTDEFVPTGKLDGLEVLSMAGRALFFRFLHDRGIVWPKELGEICPSAARDGATLKDVFANARRAAETSAWLDETFNGDFLPLPLQPPDISTDDRPRRKRPMPLTTRPWKRKPVPVFSSILTPSSTDGPCGEAPLSSHCLTGTNCSSRTSP